MDLPTGTSSPDAARWDAKLGEYVLDWEDIRNDPDPHALGLEFARVRLPPRLRGVRVGPRSRGHGGGRSAADHVTDAFVLGGVRTPVGRYGGSLSHLRTDDLLGRTMVAACERVGVPLERIEDIAAGCVNPAHEGMGDIARWAALAAGFPDSVPAITVNRFCASSLSGAISIAHAIRSDELSVGLAAGVESMSRSGWALMKGDAPFMPRGPVLDARHDVGRRRWPAEPDAARP